jgi:hypothetical protein
MADVPITAAATFCATLVDEWARCGITHAVVAPGSRSTPLALALAADDRVRVHVHHDERSAGFMALGLATATGRPAPVLTTSGTATVELHPAVVEAHHGRVPMICCTADRPPELLHVGAPQTIDQSRLYGKRGALVRRPRRPRRCGSSCMAFGRRAGRRRGHRLACRPGAVEPAVPRPAGGPRPVTPASGPIRRTRVARRSLRRTRDRPPPPGELGRVARRSPGSDPRRERRWWPPARCRCGARPGSGVGLAGDRRSPFGLPRARGHHDLPCRCAPPSPGLRQRPSARGGAPAGRPIRVEGRWPSGSLARRRARARRPRRRLVRPRPPGSARVVCRPGPVRRPARSGGANRRCRTRCLARSNRGPRPMPPPRTRSPLRSPLIPSRPSPRWPATSRPASPRAPRWSSRRRCRFATSSGTRDPGAG